MERATRFLLDMHCGRKDCKLFKNAMRLLCHVIEHTGDLTLPTDGERRYGSRLFELCSQALMYAKETGRLQERLDVYWIVHNFVRVHFTTRRVPAAALGILDHDFALHALFLIQKVEAPRQGVADRLGTTHQQFAGRSGTFATNPFSTVSTRAYKRRLPAAPATLGALQMKHFRVGGNLWNCISEAARSWSPAPPRG